MVPRTKAKAVSPTSPTLNPSNPVTSLLPQLKSRMNHSLNIKFLTIFKIRSTLTEQRFD